MAVTPACVWMGGTPDVTYKLGTERRRLHSLPPEFKTFFFFPRLKTIIIVHKLFMEIVNVCKYLLD